MISRFTLAAEALILLLPVSFLAVIGGGVVLLNTLSTLGTDDTLFLVLMLGSWASLACGWPLVSTFVAHGRVGLQRAHKSLFVVSCLGAVPVAVGLAFSAMGGYSPLSVFALGLPAVVPLLHVIAESRRAAS